MTASNEAFETVAVPLSELGFLANLKFWLRFIFKFALLTGIFFLLLIARKELCSDSEEALWFILGVMGVSAVYMLFWAISEAIRQSTTLFEVIANMFKGIFKALLLTVIISLVIGFFPIALPLAIIGFVFKIKRVLKILEFIKNTFLAVLKMIPMLLLSAMITLLLLFGIFDNTTDFPAIPPFSLLGFFDSFDLNGTDCIYMILTMIVSLVLAFKYSLRNALLRVSVIFLAIPIMALMLYVIQIIITIIPTLVMAILNPAALQQNSFQDGGVCMNGHYEGDNTFVPDDMQFVKGYTRANGTEVSAYLRHK